MRILFVAYGIPPETLGGAETITYGLCKELSKNHTVAIIFSKVDANHPNFTVIKQKYENFWTYQIIINRIEPWEKLIENQDLERLFEEILTSYKPDIVHFQHLISLCPSLIKIAKDLGFKVVITPHDYWLLCPRLHLYKPSGDRCIPNTQSFSCIGCISHSSLKLKIALYFYYPIYFISRKFFGARHLDQHHLKILFMNLYRKEYMIELLKSIDLIVCISKFQLNIFKNYGISENKLLHIYLGIDISWVKRFKRKKSDQIRIGFIAARIGEIKGLHILIEAFKKIDAKNIELNIFGDITQDNTYVNNIKKMSNDPRIRFRGKFYNIEKALSEIDVLVFPSICYEGSPITILEAFATKTPVVASNIGGMAELVENMKTGLLFKVGDPQDLREKLETIIHDRNLITKLSGNITNVKTIEEYGGEMEEIYKNLE